MKISRLFVLIFALILVISMLSGCSNKEAGDIENIKNTEDIENIEDIQEVEDTNVPENPAVVSNEIFSITVPDDWVEKIYVEIYDDSIEILQKAAYESFGGGWLCSVQMYKDDFYKELPCYEILTTDEALGITYLVQYPSDVQADVENAESMKEYFEMFEQIPDIVKNTYKILSEPADSK